MECNISTDIVKLSQRPETTQLIQALNFANFRIIPPSLSPWYDVDCERGKAQIRTIYYEEPTDDHEGIAISDNWSMADTLFPCHSHEGIETFIVWQGCMELRVGIPPSEEKITLKPTGRPYWILGDQKHWAYYPEYTRYLAILRPPDPSWKFRPG